MPEFEDPEKRPPLSGPVPPLPPARPRNLDDLMEHGKFFADFRWRKDGCFPATYFLLTPKGPVLFQLGPEPDAVSREMTVAVIKLICVAHAATAVVLVMDAWANFGADGAPPDPKEKPSEVFHCQEVVMLAGENRETRRQHCFPIVRTGAGGYFGLGEDRSPPGATLEGRFVGLLPPRPPTANQSRWALRTLRKLGIKPTWQRAPGDDGVGPG